MWQLSSCDSYSIFIEICRSDPPRVNYTVKDIKGTTYGSITEYTCVYGYESDFNITCLSNGLWSQTSVCISKSWIMQCMFSCTWNWKLSTELFILYNYFATCGKNLHRSCFVKKKICTHNEQQDSKLCWQWETLIIRCCVCHVVSLNRTNLNLKWNTA